MGKSRTTRFIRVVAVIAALCTTAVSCTPGSEASRDLDAERLTAWLRLVRLAQLVSGPDEPTDPGARPGDGRGTSPTDDVTGIPAEHDRPPRSPVVTTTTIPTTTPHEPTVGSDTYIASTPRMGIGECPIYPTNNAFHADITGLETLPESDLIIASMGDEQVSPPSSKVRDGIRKGIPINLVDSRVDRMRTVVKQGFLLQPESLGKFPIPSSPRIQGYPGVNSDQHLLVFDTATCRSHEFFIFRPPYLSIYQTFEANSAYTLDLTSNEMPKRASTVSALSLLAGMIRYEEVESGSVDHVLVAAVPNTSNQTGIWPSAPRTDGPNPDPYAPKIGQWLRLKHVDTTRFGPKAQIIIRAMQTHGVVIFDTNHGRISLGKENDSRWDDEDLKTLRQLTAADFEVVDASPMMVSRDSYEIR